MNSSILNIEITRLNNLIMKVDVSGLRAFYKLDRTGQHVLESFAIRRNNWKITTVSSLFSVFRLIGLEISRKEIVRVFKELERFNCGEFVLGKVAGDRNLQSRLVWRVPPGMVGKIAMDKKSRG